MSNCIKFFSKSLYEKYNENLLDNRLENSNFARV